jgi:hypothetical protein
MTENTKRSSLHMEKFKKTGKARQIWDLAKMSTRSVAISTELPEDIINLMEENGPIMEARGLIATNTSYAIMQYSIISKMIALDMAINGLKEPNPELTKFLIKRKKIRQPLPKKKMMEYYPGKNTIPMSSAIPIEIAKLAEEYGPILVKHNIIPSSTPYNIWKFCVTSVMLELSRLINNNTQ